MRAARTRWESILVRQHVSVNVVDVDFPRADPMAVLDGNFKVRGVANLRVVDISSWPTIPGFFVATPTYMVRTSFCDSDQRY